MWADLHVHSRWSDGSMDIKTILDTTRERGLTHLAVTDHDTLAHLPDFFLAGKNYDIRLMSGIEISAAEKKTEPGLKRRKVHILGYGFGRGIRIEEFCRPIRIARNMNTLEKLELMNREGFRISEQEIREVNGYPEVLYKQHLMKGLIRRGFAGEGDVYGDLYNWLFKNGGPCFGDISYPDARDAVRVIKEDGGLAVLAHPGLEEVYDLIPSLVDAGLDGIEYYHESHKLDDHKRILVYSERFNLLLTGGSDTHGTLGSTHHLGDITAPASFANSPLAERFVCG